MGSRNLEFTDLQRLAGSKLFCFLTCVTTRGFSHGVFMFEQHVFH